MSTILFGYHESPYLDVPGAYLGGSGIEYLAMQASVTINPAARYSAAQVAVTINNTIQNGLQSALTINNTIQSGFQSALTINKTVQNGLQSALTINNTIQSGFQASTTNMQGIQGSFQAAASNSANLYAMGMQSNVTVSQVLHTGMQSYVTINGQVKILALQSDITIIKSIPGAFQAKIFASNGVSNVGLQSSVSRHLHYDCSYYLSEDAYLTTPYMVTCQRVPLPFQAEIKGINSPYYAMQGSLTVTGSVRYALQAKTTITLNKLYAVQANAVVTNFVLAPFQSALTITKTSHVALQSSVTVSQTKRYAFQAGVTGSESYSFQGRVVVYNTTNIRILTDFVSRGVSGTSWTASSTQVGDFSANNLNTDIVEQVWRSATGDVTGLELICDTGVTQGVFMDTLALLNHNFSGSASVFFDGSNSPVFATTETVAVPLERTANAYYIAPVIPLVSFRYWRLRISDTANPNNFVSIGTILFGSSIIFAGECFTDVVKFGRKQFTDQVFTEGFTNVKNDRGQKSNLGLDFKSLNYNRANYRNLRSVIETQSTILKSLWIPTPQYSSRFAVFGRLTELPNESHNDRGAGNDYVDVSVQIDEAE